MKMWVGIIVPCSGEKAENQRRQETLSTVTWRITSITSIEHLLCAGSLKKKNCLPKKNGKKKDLPHNNPVRYIIIIIPIL